MPFAGNLVSYGIARPYTILQQCTTMQTSQQTNGRIHLYTGHGKGKTTAAAGLCLRALGAGLRVLFVQFMKGRATSELKPLETLGATVFRAPTSPKFMKEMTEAEQRACATAQEANLAYARQQAPHYDLLVLDEVVGAISTDMVSLDAVLDFLRHRPDRLEVVLTGRNAPEPIRDIADYLSDISAEKHPYAQGVQARKGIEW